VHLMEITSKYENSYYGLCCERITSCDDDSINDPRNKISDSGRQSMKLEFDSKFESSLESTGEAQ
jgi:hypothetical protein